MRELNLNQDSLPRHFQNVKLGQNRKIKIILFLLIIACYFLASFLASYIGVNTSLEVGASLKYKFNFILVGITILLWISLGIKSFRYSTLIVPVWLIILLPVIALYFKINEKEFSYNLGFPAIILYLAFSTIIFSLFCFANSLTTIVFSQTKAIWFFKFVILIIILFGLLIGAYYVLFPEINAGSIYGKFWLSSLDAKIAIISTSFIYVFGFLFSAFLANRVRKIPYSPSSPFSTFLSSVVIATGVWCGTSFYDLDLSYVNFRGSNLANTDLRARKLYRTCFQGVTGLERARVDSRYLDLENPKVQKLLTEGRSEDRDFSGLNLRGAYLQNAELRRFNFTDTDLTGADMQNADLRGSLLVRAQVIGVDFTNADLTGCCIQDWSINSQTCFTDVRCEYIYRKLDEHGEPIERFPANRNFELREFESLYQEVENVVELIFKEGENWQAALFSLRKLQLEDEELGLELKSIEKRGDLWVLKVTHNNAVSKQEVENRLNASFDEMKQKLAAKEQQIDKLLDIVADQAKTLKGYSKQPLGTSNNFFIVESAITNLSGSGQIDYQEAANQVRNIVATSANSGENTSFATNLLDKFQEREVAVNPTQQTELIEQIILAEAQKDTVFKQFILLQGEQISEAMPESSISTAIRNAIAKLN